MDGHEFGLAEDKVIAVKSTNGYFLAIPEVEMEWEGGIIVLVKLHIKEDFLFEVIKAGLKLKEIDFSEDVGWLEIRGWIRKSNYLRRAHRKKRLPGRYHVGDIWRQTNLIMHPLELNRKPDELRKLLEEIKESVSPA